MKFSVNDVVETRSGEGLVVVDLEDGLYIILADTGNMETHFGEELKVKTSAESLKKHYSRESFKSLSSMEQRAVMSIAVTEGGDHFSDEFSTYVLNQLNARFFIAFVDAAYQKLKTHKHFGSKAIFEDLRWDRYRRGDAGEFYKVNNKFTPDLGRLAMVIFAPDLEGFFFKRHRTVA